MRGRRLIAAVVFLAAYAALAAGRVPFTRLRRTGAAAAGAVLMLATGSIGLPAALRAIDRRTILLIGSLSRVDVWTFSRALAPIALVGCAIDVAVIWFVFRHELHATAEDLAAVEPPGMERTRQRGPRGPLSTWVSCIDWKLLVLFVGLFVVVAGAEQNRIDRQLFEVLRLPVTALTLAFGVWRLG